MIIHQAIGMTKPVIAVADPAKDLEKGLPVHIISKNLLVVIPTTGDMINRTGKLYA
jgi:hypothetical protein